MERFLSECADYIYRKHGQNLSGLCLVFPNRRSGTFFNSYLQRLISRPVISPEITPIHEFMLSLSSLDIADRLFQVITLYDIYSEISGTRETLDDFYFWGEVLLSDFNDIDKYLINARDLYTNLAGLKEIEKQFEYLSESQKATIRQFWDTLGHWEENRHQDQFISVWKHLYRVYSRFSEELKSKGMASEGMAYRAAAELITKEESIKINYEKYYFLGLNALNECEMKVLGFLRHNGKAEFLWDYDNFYLHDESNSAGHFIRNNLILFPPPHDFKPDNQVFDVKKNIQVVAVPSLHGQTQLIPYAIESFSTFYNNHHDNTAIILADEALLFPTLGSIPEEIAPVNITMGYSIRNSIIHGFVGLISDLLKNAVFSGTNEVSFYFRNVLEILAHQLLAGLETERTTEFAIDVKLKNRFSVNAAELGFSPLHKIIFSLPETIPEYPDYYLDIFRSLFQHVRATHPDNKILPELIYATCNSIEKLRESLTELKRSSKHSISQKVFFRLLSQYMGSVSVPFEGEPLSGLQVMGILETRCLDFDNLIILGLNEGQWPQLDANASYIPYNLRKGFGLPGIDEQEAISAYYFYRLIQKAGNVIITYNTSKDGPGAGELSRYGVQLRFLSNHQPILTSFSLKLSGSYKNEITIPGSAELSRQMLNSISVESPFSPSRLVTYLTCRLRFYYKYIVELPEPEEVMEEIDARTFGTIFHEIMEKLYRPLTGKLVQREVIAGLRKNKDLIGEEIIRSINKHFFKQSYSSVGDVVLTGKSHLIAENLKIYIGRVLEIDETLAPFTILGLEKKMVAKIEVPGVAEPVFTGGIIDRIDEKDGKIRIIDYKTGSVESMNFESPEDLFDPSAIFKTKEILQAMVYCWIIDETGHYSSRLSPGIYSLRKFFTAKYDPEIKFKKSDFQFSEVKKIFIEGLKQLLCEIFHPENIFIQTDDAGRCKFCAYNVICARF